MEPWISNHYHRFRIFCCLILSWMKRASGTGEILTHYLKIILGLVLFSNRGVEPVGCWFVVTWYTSRVTTHWPDQGRQCSEQIVNLFQSFDHWRFITSVLYQSWFKVAILFAADFWFTDTGSFPLQNLDVQSVLSCRNNDCRCLSNLPSLDFSLSWEQKKCTKQGKCCPVGKNVRSTTFCGRNNR